MKKNKKSFVTTSLFWSIAVLFLGVNLVSAATAKLNWQANTESDLAGYKVYWGTTSRGTTANPPGNYANSQDVGKVTEYTINNISNTGTTYFSITAKDTSNNESGFSGEVKKKPGDINKDTLVNITDITRIVYYLGWQAGNIPAADAGVDVDVSGTVNISDITATVINLGNSG